MDADLHRMRAEVIRRFDAYEAVVSGSRPQLPDFNNPAEAAKPWRHRVYPQLNGAEEEYA